MSIKLVMSVNIIKHQFNVVDCAEIANLIAVCVFGSKTTL